MSKRKSEDSGDEENEFTVEKILDKRRNKDGGLEYLIKVRLLFLSASRVSSLQWDGFPMEDSTWESEANASCPELIAEYERERKRKVSFAFRDRSQVT